ncbi:T-cell immunoglobulin and mucin domain-containing protein 4 [Engraulis encrasicolus]|uniref:T-cell immunoglobulin and mucin domain-containing protein 4 n=1 Tax=Engraulis encrasicolus TaxID=184585 RepID=UPI002FD1DF66
MATTANTLLTYRMAAPSSSTLLQWILLLLPISGKSIRGTAWRQTLDFHIASQHDSPWKMKMTPKKKQLLIQLLKQSGGNKNLILQLSHPLSSTGLQSSNQPYRVTEGSSVVLACQYSVRRHGVSHVCWGRDCGTFWCNDILVQADDNGVVSTVSDRYRLIGDAFSGQMDLGIQRIQQADNGPYCCRVDIDGLFNDKKVSYTLVVSKAPPSTTAPPTTTATITDPPPATTVHWRNVLSSHFDIVRQNVSHIQTDTLFEDSFPSITLQINIPVLSLSLSLLLLLVAALMLLAFKRGLHRKALDVGCLSSKEPRHIIYEIRTRRPVAENIYTIE